MATPDVTVVGAGAIGLSIAFECARRGARARVVERRGIGAGSSGGPVGALAPHAPFDWNAKKEFQFRSLVASGAFWAGVEAASGAGVGYARLGRLQAIGTERALALARARADGAARHWRGEAEWRVVRARGGWEPASPTGFLVEDTLSARIDPRRACEGLAGALAAAGGEIVRGESAEGGRVVWATGWRGLGDLSRALGREVGTGVKGQALSVRLDARGEPQLFADGVYVVPHEDGTVGIGSTREEAFDDPEATDGALDALLERAAGVCPALAGAPVARRWAGVRPRASTRAPMLGPWPGREGHFVANGGFGIGLGLAPGIAKAMADLLLDGRDAIPEGFRVEDNL